MLILKKYETPTTITFTGGLGAQIVSACAYYYLKSISCPVQADLTYFDGERITAKEGEIGKVSVWPWSLDKYGIQSESFIQNTFIDIGPHVIHDGFEKISLWLAGLQLQSVHTTFKIPDSYNNSLRDLVNFEKFICIHLRRGDYINVATHIQDDTSFIRILTKFSKLINNLLIVSDSPLAPEFSQKVLSLGFNVKTYINGDDF